MFMSLKYRSSRAKYINYRFVYIDQKLYIWKALWALINVYIFEFLSFTFALLDD